MVLAYIDPGTGSMLFGILVGVFATLTFFFRALIIKLKFILSGGRVSTDDQKKLKYVIFSDSKRYFNIFEPICDIFEERNEKITYFTMSEDDPALKKNYKYVNCEYIGSGNNAYARLNVLNAEMCLSTTPGLDVYQWKRSKNVDKYIHVFHAVGDPITYRMFGIDYYDVILLNGEFQKKSLRKLEKLRHLKERELVVVGCPYMDELKKKYENKITTDNQKNIKKETKIVLLAPSWGKSGILSKYGEKIIKALIDTGYEIIVRPHPQSLVSEKAMLDKLMKDYPDNDKFSWNFDNDNFEVLCKADILISDFSGVIFDYVFTFNKPVIFADTSYDTAPYDAAWFDETLWDLTILPKIGQKLNNDNIDNIKEVIDNTILSEKYQKGIKEVKDIAWEEKGKAAENIVNYMME